MLAKARALVSAYEIAEWERSKALHALQCDGSVKEPVQSWEKKGGSC